MDVWNKFAKIVHIQLNKFGKLIIFYICRSSAIFYGGKFLPKESVTRNFETIIDIFLVSERVDV